MPFKPQVTPQRHAVTRLAVGQPGLSSEVYQLQRAAMQQISQLRGLGPDAGYLGRYLGRGDLHSCLPDSPEPPASTGTLSGESRGAPGLR